MILFFSGLLLFFGAHLFSLVPARDAVRARLGANAFKGVYSVVSLLGIILIVMGYSRVPYEQLFAPLPWARGALFAAMPFVFVLFASANMSTHIRRVLRHPMLIATLIWSGLHLLANGELAATWLFGAFAAYAVLNLLVSVVRGRPGLPLKKPVAWKFDVMAVAGGVVVYAVFLKLHGWLFVPILPSTSTQGL